jgi:methionine-rich copper-binding protein CopC
MKATRLWAAAAAALLALVVCAGPASAHTTLRKASPGIGSTVRPPSQIVLTYADPVRFTQVLVSDAAGRRYQSGAPSAVDNTVTQKVGSALPNGRYTVAWRVVAPDGHPVEGTYQFTVTGSTTALPPAPGKAADQPGSSSGTSVWWIALIVLLVLGVGAGVVMLRRGLKADAEQ